VVLERASGVSRGSGGTRRWDVSGPGGLPETRGAD
jgi:hypothetical protein